MLPDQSMGFSPKSPVRCWEGVGVVSPGARRWPGLHLQGRNQEVEAALAASQGVILEQQQQTSWLRRRAAGSGAAVEQLELELGQLQEQNIRLRLEAAKERARGQGLEEKVQELEDRCRELELEQEKVTLGQSKRRERMEELENQVIRQMRFVNILLQFCPQLKNKFQVAELLSENCTLKERIVELASQKRAPRSPLIRVNSCGCASPFARASPLLCASPRASPCTRASPGYSSPYTCTSPARVGLTHLTFPLICPPTSSFF